MEEKYVSAKRDMKCLTMSVYLAQKHSFLTNRQENANAQKLHI